MVYKIATKNGVLSGYGFGEEVTFADDTVTVQTFQDEASFQAALQPLLPQG